MTLCPKRLPRWVDHSYGQICKINSKYEVQVSLPFKDPHAKLLTGKLHGTPYGDDDYMLTLREEFDEDTKCLFRDDGDSEVYIRIGGRRDNFEDENGLCKIEFGLLEAQRYALPFLNETCGRLQILYFSQDIVDAFEPSVSATVNAIRKHIAGRRDAVSP